MDLKKYLVKASENWPVKAASIAIAIILFVFHRMSILEERFFSSPLVIEAADNLAPASSYPRMIRVSMRGEANSIYPILEDDIETYLDLSSYTKSGSYRAPVRYRKKGTALGVEPLEIRVDPMEIRIDLDERVTKNIPLEPSFQGYTETGYELVSYTLSPPQVVVDGPKKLMDKLDSLSTALIDLGGRSDDFTLDVQIMNRDPLLVIRGNSSAEFRGYVKQLIIIRSFDGLDIELRNLEPHLICETHLPSGSVRIQGAQRTLESYSGSGIHLYLDCKGIGKAGTYTLKVGSEAPEEYTIARCEPQSLSITIGEAGP